MSETSGNPNLREPATGELVNQLSEQVSHLVRDELRLARAELTQQGKQAGLGAGLTGSGGILALYGLGALILAVIAALALAMPVWAAALIVGVAVLLVAGALAMVGVRQVKQTMPPRPDEAIASTKRDVQTVKESAKR